MACEAAAVKLAISIGLENTAKIFPPTSWQHYSHRMVLDYATNKLADVTQTFLFNR